MGALIGGGLIAIIQGLLAGHTHALVVAAPSGDAAGQPGERRDAVLAGLALGLAFLGVPALAEAVLDCGAPPWSAYFAASSAAPWLAAAMTVPGLLERAMEQAYAGALVGSLAGAAAVSFLAWRWFTHLAPARE